jgi:CRP/FNR family cyclic AMP-dependent transcriptional regulator
MTLETFQHGEIIFREGEESDCCYVIEQGNVEVFKRLQQGTVLLAVLGVGEIVGEMGLISDQPRSASATADGMVTLRKISREAFTQSFSTLPLEALLAVRAMLERLRTTNQNVSKLMDKQAQFQLASSAPPPVKRVILSPLSQLLKEHLGKGMVISLPYRVGASIAGEAPNPLDWNSLLIPCKEEESQLSRNHFAIQRNQEGLVVLDRGSKTGTLVNDVKIGAETGQLQQTLRPGDNVVVAGDALSPYRFCITWETE